MDDPFDKHLDEDPGPCDDNAEHGSNTEDEMDVDDGDNQPAP